MEYVVQFPNFRVTTTVENVWHLPRQQTGSRSQTIEACNKTRGTSRVRRYDVVMLEDSHTRTHTLTQYTQGTHKCAIQLIMEA